MMICTLFLKNIILLYFNNRKCYLENRNFIKWMIMQFFIDVLWMIILISLHLPYKLYCDHSMMSYIAWQITHLFISRPTSTLASTTSLYYDTRQTPYRDYKRVLLYPLLRSCWEVPQNYNTIPIHKNISIMKWLSTFTSMEDDSSNW